MEFHYCRVQIWHQLELYPFHFSFKPLLNPFPFFFSRYLCKPFIRFLFLPFILWFYSLYYLLLFFSFLFSPFFIYFFLTQLYPTLPHPNSPLLALSLADFPDEDLVVLDMDSSGFISSTEFIDFFKSGTYMPSMPIYASFPVGLFPTAGVSICYCRSNFNWHFYR